MNKEKSTLPIGAGCQTNSNKNHTRQMTSHSNTMRAVHFISFFHLKFNLTFCWVSILTNFHWHKTQKHRSIVILFVVGNYRELIEYLNGTSDLLAKNGNILDNVLETLDVQQHSLGVLYVLVAKFTNLSVCWTTLMRIFLARNLALTFASIWNGIIHWNTILLYFALKQNSSTEGENVIRLVREFIQSCNGEQARHAPQACE